MFNRCANDLFGYCSGEPEWTERPAEQMIREGNASLATGALAGGKCSLDPKSCGRFTGGVAPVVLPPKKAKVKPKL